MPLCPCMLGGVTRSRVRRFQALGQKLFHSCSSRRMEEKQEAGEMEPCDEILEWLKTVSNPGNKYEFECGGKIAVGRSQVTTSRDRCVKIEARKAVSKDYDIDYEGEGIVVYESGDYFEGKFHGLGTNRSGVLTRLGTGNGALTWGTWNNEDQLEGVADEEIPEDGGCWRRSVYKRGLKHGISRTFGAEASRTAGTPTNLKELAFYENGNVTGHAWKGLVGGAFIFGTVSHGEDAAISGDDCLFIYPDFRKAICGTFRCGNLVAGRMHDVVGIEFRNHVLIPLVSKKGYGPTIKRSVSTSRQITERPRQTDLWESDRVEVRPSGLSGAGEGLYAKIRLDPGNVIAFFNGVRLEKARTTSCGETEETTFSDYRIRLNSQLDLDIPPDCAMTDNYHATLGHKANHDFVPNARWSQMDHARFGLICAIKATKDISPGEEILVNYGLGMAEAPTWYKSLWVEHCRKQRKMTDQEIRDWCGRQYAMKGRVVDLSKFLVKG